MHLAKPSGPAQIEATLSSARLSTYRGCTASLDDALVLYAWNAQVSASLMLPSHFVEVSTRNAVSEVLTQVYGPQWPWDQGFELSLPNPAKMYSPRRDLTTTRSKHTSSGHVIADLRFAFWGSLFTSRHHHRLWQNRIHTVFPNALTGDEKQLRTSIYRDLDEIRRLRNRIAHHEPIMTRSLSLDLERMTTLVGLRSACTRAWLDAMETVTTQIAQRP